MSRSTGSSNEENAAAAIDLPRWTNARSKSTLSDEPSAARKMIVSVFCAARSPSRAIGSRAVLALATRSSGTVLLMRRTAQAWCPSRTESVKAWRAAPDDRNTAGIGPEVSIRSALEEAAPGETGRSSPADEGTTRRLSTRRPVRGRSDDLRTIRRVFRDASRAVAAAGVNAIRTWSATRQTPRSSSRRACVPWRSTPTEGSARG